jgi:hypothetical protein
MPEDISVSSFCNLGWMGRGVQARGMVTYSSVLRLWNPEENDDGLDAAPYGEDNVCSPADLVHCYRPSELV